MKDYYETLEVHPKASEEVIKRAYRVLAEKYHPDRYPPAEQRWATERMQEVNQAYQVLSHPGKRGKYDRRRAVGGGEGGSGLWDEFRYLVPYLNYLITAIFLIAAVRIIPMPFRALLLPVVLGYLFIRHPRTMGRLYAGARGALRKK